MKIKYHGHACFTVTSNNYSIVLDPYKGVNGFDDVNLVGNEVICSHDHFDHCYKDGVKIIYSDDNPFTANRIATYHDNSLGKERGTNFITLLSSENKKVAHLGDLGHLLNDEQISPLYNADVVMIPVGGFYTIGPNEAVNIIKKLNPKAIIPMHYKDKNKGLEVLKEVDEFISLLAELSDLCLLVKAYEQEIEI